MYDAADVWTYGVDGSVGAETRGVDPQVSGALFDHIPDDVDLHLGKREDALWISPLKLELVVETIFTPRLLFFFFFF